jgi:hypothetical protein
MGVFKKLLNQKQLIFRPVPIHTCQKTEIKSHWTVRLSLRFLADILPVASLIHRLKYVCSGAYPGGDAQDACASPLPVHLSSLCIPPPFAFPPPQPERLVMRKTGGWGGRSAKNVHPPRLNPRYAPVFACGYKLEMLCVIKYTVDYFDAFAQEKGIYVEGIGTRCRQ